MIHGEYDRRENVRYRMGISRKALKHIASKEKFFQ